MTEEEQTSVEPQAQQEPHPTESESVHDDRQEEAKEVQQPTRKDAEYNWAEARRQMQEQKKLIEEQREVINQLSRGQEEEETLSEDDILTVKQAKKLGKERERAYQTELQKQREEILLLKYPDINEVLSPENIEQFNKNEPELALSLKALKDDPYSQAIAAYKLLKKTTAVNSRSSALEKKKAAENMQKPVSVQAVTKQSAIGNAHAFENGLTQEYKNKLWEEMQQSMKQG